MIIACVSFSTTKSDSIFPRASTEPNSFVRSQNEACQARFPRFLLVFRSRISLAPGGKLNTFGCCHNFRSRKFSENNRGEGCRGGSRKQSTMDCQVDQHSKVYKLYQCSYRTILKLMAHLECGQRSTLVQSLRGRTLLICQLFRWHPFVVIRAVRCLFVLLTRSCYQIFAMCRLGKGVAYKALSAYRMMMSVSKSSCRCMSAVHLTRHSALASAVGSLDNTVHFFLGHGSLWGPSFEHQERRKVAPWHMT